MSIVLEIAQQARDEWDGGDPCTGAGRAIASGKAMNPERNRPRYNLSREEEDEVCWAEEEVTLIVDDTDARRLRHSVATGWLRYDFDE